MWRDFVSARSDTNCTDQPEWRLLFQELYGIHHYSYAWVDGSAIRGVLSLYHIRSPFLGNMLVTSPYFGYGGFYADDPEARHALLKRAEELARHLSVDVLELRLTHPLPSPFQANTDFLEYELPVRGPVERVWGQQLTSGIRWDVRKSLKQGFAFTLSQEFSPCSSLLIRTMRDLGSPTHGPKFYELLTRYFPGRVWFSQVQHRGETVAAGVVLRYRDSILTPYMGSLKQIRNLGTNYRQYWGILEFCLDNGITTFQFGRSPKGSAQARFKQKWGARPRPVYYNFRVMQSGKKYRSTSRLSPSQQLAAGLWKFLPLPLARRVGPWIYRCVP